MKFSFILLTNALATSSSAIYLLPRSASILFGEIYSVDASGARDPPLKSSIAPRNLKMHTEREDLPTKLQVRATQGDRDSASRSATQNHAETQRETQRQHLDTQGSIRVASSSQQSSSQIPPISSQRRQPLTGGPSSPLQPPAIRRQEQQQQSLVSGLRQLNLGGRWPQRESQTARQEQFQRGRSPTVRERPGLSLVRNQQNSRSSSQRHGSSSSDWSTSSTASEDQEDFFNTIGPGGFPSRSPSRASSPDTSDIPKNRLSITMTGPGYFHVSKGQYPYHRVAYHKVQEGQTRKKEYADRTGVAVSAHHVTPTRGGPSGHHRTMISGDYVDASVYHRSAIRKQENPPEGSDGRGWIESFGRAGKSIQNVHDPAQKDQNSIRTIARSVHGTASIHLYAEGSGASSFAHANNDPTFPYLDTPGKSAGHPPYNDSHIFGV